MGQLPFANPIDLAGPWLIRPDPDDRGFSEQWEREPVHPDAWQPIDLPCAWQTVLGTAFHGIAWLRRTIRLPVLWRYRSNPRRHRIWLCFDAVATDCRAWINTVDVGRHVGDYLPFHFDITEPAHGRREIDITLRVDELFARQPDAPGELQRGHITKGFHDVVSIHHGGVWQSLRLERTGPLRAIPDGVSIFPDPETGAVRIVAQLEPTSRRRRGCMKVNIEALHAVGLASGSTSIAPDADCAVVDCRMPTPRRWSPRHPNVYAADVQLFDGRRLSDRHRVRFGFRTIEASGRRIVLNGSPILLRGVLDWGHEPDHLAPAPTDDEIRRRFRDLRRLGFNTICLCMWCPPRRFYDIADETGMLIWQQHPVWQSPMQDQDLPEYRRLYEAFMRRDGNHPSVIIVSGACEHPSFNRELAHWWWDTARRMLPDRLLQLQSSFFAWTDAERSDLHDEHTYESSGRWVSYLADVDAHLQSLSPKPFVMGETVLFTAWPDLAELKSRAADAPPWWLPRTFDHLCELQEQWRAQLGGATVARVRRQAERYALLGRKFQIEQFRRHPGYAGIVMNHLRDVPQCQCGFMDDLGRWRFTREQCRGWLGDAALLLATPEQRRGFVARAGSILPAELALSNFSRKSFEGTVSLLPQLAETPPITVLTPTLACPCGEVRSTPVEISLPALQHPKWMQIIAEADGLPRNWWDLWLFPPPADSPPAGVYRFAALPFSEAEAWPDDVEKAYSRGYGLPARHWKPIMPDPARFAPHLPPLHAGEPMPTDASAILTHRLTGTLLHHVNAGGRVILLASRAAGGLGTCPEWLFGGVPFVIERGPLVPGDSEWIVDLLGYDLTRRSGRAIPVDDLGLTDYVQPLIRLIYTHDQSRRARFLDFLFMTRLGDGLLIVSSVDHSEDAGRYLLDRLITFAAGDPPAPEARLTPEQLQRFTLDA